MVEFQKLLQKQFNEMCKTGKLFRSSLTGDQIWEFYLSSFPKEMDPIFRDPNSTTHNCKLCNNFIRRYGNIVAIDENYNIITIFDVEPDEEYMDISKKLSSILKKSTISDVFFETYVELNSLPYEVCNKKQDTYKLGIVKNIKRYTKDEAEKYPGVVKENEVRTFNHLYLDLPKDFVDQSGKSVESLMGGFRDSKNVFQRAMEEIPIDTLLLVKDLINQGSLLDGQTHLFKVEQFIPLKKSYDETTNKDNWCWANSYNLNIARFKNELIGVLCSELAEGKEINESCQAWNRRVDPVNYMKATAPITKKQIQEAKDFVEENGYTDSFDRRFATIDDIKASEIKHINVGDGKLKGVSIFDNVKSTSTRHKRSEFDGIEEVNIEKFLNDILPGCSSIEAFLTNNQEGNLVSLSTACIKDSKPIFKWNNNYSWTFNGNLAGKSQIKEEVKSRGGNVTGVLRFSITWNEDGTDNSDLDAWCSQPNRQNIGYSAGFRKDQGDRKTSYGGQLDLDIIHPSNKLAVENIYFGSKSIMGDGVYKFWINPYDLRGSGYFKAEIEFDGEIYSYEYNKNFNSVVHIAEVTLKNGEFTIEHKLPESGVSSKEIYGLETNQFHKVNLVCLTPNHWEDNKVGNKHYLFMLEGCKSPVSIRSFHNENLIPELLQHRKVMEVLGTTNMIEPSDKQLSGIGFNATVKDELILRLQGSHKRIIKVKF